MSDDFITKDSGERRVFETGSVRDSRKGKGRFDLIPAYPLKRLAQLYERGAEKYADNNWQKGQPLANYLDSAMRHMNDYRDGDRAEDHLIAVAWNVFAYIWTERAIEQGKLPASLGEPAPAPVPELPPAAIRDLTQKAKKNEAELLKAAKHNAKAYCLCKANASCTHCSQIKQIDKRLEELES